MNALLFALALLGAGPPITYTLPSAGNVSLAVFDSTGKMVRPLLYGQKQAAGAHAVAWDGNDGLGQPAPPGTYQWRLLQTPGFSRELLCNVGVTHPWSAFDVWPGNHSGPTLICLDADDALYVAAQTSEGPPHVVKVSPDGTKKFWDDGVWGLPLTPALTGMTVVEGVLWLQQAGGTVLAKDAATGNGFVKPPIPPAGLAFANPLQAADSFNKQTLNVVGNTIERRNADGTLAATHGASRIYGPFNPQQFDTILAVACDSQGHFFTVEQFPRRVARFDSKGNLLNQWLGGLQWGSMAAFDPADPTIAFVPIDYLHWGKAKLDFANKSWTLTDLYPPIANSSWAVGKTVKRDILPAAPNCTYWEVRHIGAVTFLINKQGSFETGQSGVLVARVDGAQLTPIAYLGCLHPTLDADTLPPWWLAAQNLPATTAFKKVGYLHFAFSWSDGDGNGLVDTSEIAIASVGNQYSVARVAAVDGNWNVTLINAANQMAVIANEGTAAAPKWDWNNWTLTPLSSDGATPTYRGCYSLGDGTLHVLAVAPAAAPVAGVVWPNRLNTAARLVQFDATGKQLIAAGQHSTLATPAAGTFADPRAIVGSVNGSLVVLDSTIHASVWTADGLFAGSFEDDSAYLPSRVTQPWQGLAYGNQRPIFGGNPTFTESGTIYNDSHWGQVFTGPDGTVYWGSMAPNSTPLYRISGFDGWQRQTGTLTIQ